MEAGEESGLPNNRRTQIGAKGMRELDRVELQTPDGEWAIYFEGREHLRLADGVLRVSPEKPTFTEEATGRAWLDGGPAHGN